MLLMSSHSPSPLYSGVPEQITVDDDGESLPLLLLLAALALLPARIIVVVANAVQAPTQLQHRLLFRKTIDGWGDRQMDQGWWIRRDGWIAWWWSPSTNFSPLRRKHADGRSSCIFTFFVVFLFGCCVAATRLLSDGPLLRREAGWRGEWRGWIAGWPHLHSNARTSNPNFPFRKKKHELVGLLVYISSSRRVPAPSSLPRVLRRRSSVPCQLRDKRVPVKPYKTREERIVKYGHVVLTPHICSMLR